jgi:tetratricopeptide (TPR) repeat protein
LGVVSCAAALLLASAACAATGSAWRSDIDELARDIQAYHPDPYVRCGKLTFLRRLQELRTALPGMTEQQRMVGAMRLVAMLGDTHTQLEPNRPDFAHWYPIRIYEFSDGYFVTAAHSSVPELVGAQLLEVAGKPVAQAIAAARSLMDADNAFAEKEYVFAFSNAELMKGLGYTDAEGRMQAKFKLADGHVVEKRLVPHASDDPRFDKDDSTFEWHFQAEMGGPPFGSPAEWLSAYKSLPYAAFRTTDLSRPLRLMNRRFFVGKYLPEQNAYYMQSDFVGQDFDKQFHDALLEVDKDKPRRLIVDLRYNFGGDGSHVPAMAREFIQRQAAPPWGDLYIVTGRRTLSAGIMAAVAIMQNTQHTVIGEPMSAPVNSFGDATTVQFPKTGMQLSVSTVRHQLGDDTDVSPFSPVDIPAEMSFADYAAGRDPAVDPILRGEEMRSVALIALEDGGAAAKRIYDARKARFSSVWWWSPPEEIALRTATQKLVDDKRYDDAIAAAALNTEIHPDIWNTWYNLGNAQRAGGKNQEGLESWRHVLEIDPQNDNGREIRKAFADAGKALNLGP